jgi:hypothetical protein
MGHSRSLILTFRILGQVSGYPVRQAGGDSLAGAVPLAVVDQAVGIAGDVDGKLMRCTSELPEMRVVQLQPVHVTFEEPDLLPETCLGSGATLASLKPPLDRSAPPRCPPEGYPDSVQPRDKALLGLIF